MGESKPDTLHRIRVNANIKYAIFTVDCEQSLTFLCEATARQGRQRKLLKVYARVRMRGEVRIKVTQSTYNLGQNKIEQQTPTLLPPRPNQG